MMGAESDQARMEACTKEFTRYAPVLNAHLEGKTFVLGDSYSIADIAIGVVAEAAMAVGQLHLPSQASSIP